MSRARHAETHSQGSRIVRGHTDIFSPITLSPSRTAAKTHKVVKTHPSSSPPSSRPDHPEAHQIEFNIDSNIHLHPRPSTCTDISNYFLWVRSAVVHRVIPKRRSVCTSNRTSETLGERSNTRGNRVGEAGANGRLNREQVRCHAGTGMTMSDSLSDRTRPAAKAATRVEHTGRFNNIA